MGEADAEQQTEEQAAAATPPTRPTNFRDVTRSTVHPGGFPAMSSFLRMRSAWSAGVMRFPISTKRSSSGVRTRSWKDGSSSFCIASGAAEKASTTARDFDTPRASLVKTPMAASDKQERGEDPGDPDDEQRACSHHTSTFTTRLIQNAPTAISTTAPASISQPSGVVNMRVQVVGVDRPSCTRTFRAEGHRGSRRTSFPRPTGSSPGGAGSHARASSRPPSAGVRRGCHRPLAGFGSP